MYDLRAFTWLEHFSRQRQGTILAVLKSNRLNGFNFYFQNNLQPKTNQTILKFKKPYRTNSWVFQIVFILLGSSKECQDVERRGQQALPWLVQCWGRGQIFWGPRPLPIVLQRRPRYPFCQPRGCPHQNSWVEAKGVAKWVLTWLGYYPTGIGPREKPGSLKSQMPLEKALLFHNLRIVWLVFGCKFVFVFQLNIKMN